MNTTAPGSEQVPFSKVFPWVFFVALMFFINYLDRALFGPLLPSLEAEFGVTHTASTRLLLYMSAGYATSIVISGFIASRIRPRVLVAFAIIGLGCILPVLSLVRDFTLFSLLIFLLGLLSGQYFNGGMSTMRSIVPLSQWSKAVSVHEMGPNASFFIAPALAQFILSFSDWRTLLQIMGGITLLFGLAFLLFAKGGEYPSPRVSFSGLRKVLKSPLLWIFTWLTGLSIAGEFAPYSVLTLYLTQERGFVPEDAAFILSASRIAAPAAVLLVGFVTARFGSVRTLVVCEAVHAAGLMLMAVPGIFPLYTGMFLQPVLTAMTFPPLFTLLAEGFSAKDQPMLLAVGMPIASFFGAGVMPSILGIFGDHGGFGAGFIVMGVAVALSIPLLKYAKAAPAEE